RKCANAIALHGNPQDPPAKKNPACHPICPTYPGSHAKMGNLRIINHLN
ncbi:hypothetical protein ABIE33_003817, partial [Ensifer sp. 4252]